MAGHEHLKLAGYQQDWGVGRHVLGSQVFDYWRDPWGYRVEHWTDGDVFTADVPTNVADTPVGARPLPPISSNLEHAHPASKGHLMKLLRFQGDNGPRLGVVDGDVIVALDAFDTHGPIGQRIVTADEVADPHALDLRCLVNGEVRQDSNTSGLVHDIWQQIAYLSTAFTLYPGDLLATGTPEGVGVARHPPVFLKASDVVRCEVDGIGVIENKVR